MSSVKIHPYILSGGSGSRLWPLSRKTLPKQFLDNILAGEQHSLFQRTIMRLRGDHFAAPAILGNEEHRFLIAEQMRALEQSDAAIILEPVSRNTAPAALIAALRQEPEDLILFLPSDHLIGDDERFRQTVLNAAAAARDGDLVTFGIRPRAPETGYGYIETEAVRNEGLLKVLRFVEKPDRATAEEFVRNEGYFWNAGIFLFSAGTLIEAFERHAPEFLPPCREALEKSRQDLDFLRLDAQAYAVNPDLSIDYAIMERAENIVCKPLDIPWSDLGSWEALWQQNDRDADDNVIRGEVVSQGTSSSLLLQEDEAPLLAVLGLEEVVAVSTRDAVLVATRARAQEVKELVQRLQAQGRQEAWAHARVHRPWGWYERLASGARFQVKRLFVKPGARLSLQSHMHRAEHWVVVSGTLKVVRGEKEFLISEDQSTYIPIGALHKLENPGKLPAVLIEVQTGSYFGEDDIVRYEDMYGRSSKEDT